MKNNKLTGHKRTATPIGDKLHVRGVPALGWRLECDCGFKQEGIANRLELEKIYAEHIQQSLPICTCCNEKKAVRFMSISNTQICKSCNTKKAKQWAVENPNQWERSKRESHLRKKYNLTIEQYDALLLSQNGLCAICKKSPQDSRGFRPHIDHCHETGKVRGILCGSCNRGLGAFKDNLELLKAATSYMQIHQKTA